VIREERSPLLPHQEQEDLEYSYMLKSSCFAKIISRTSLLTHYCLLSLHTFIIPIFLVCCLIYYSALLVSRQPDVVGRSCCAETHTNILVSHHCLLEDKPSLQHMHSSGFTSLP